MMDERNLSDAQWCVLDLLMRSKEKGVHSLNRMELLSGDILPTGAAMKLAWAALVMPLGLVKWTGKHDFSITDEGVALYNIRFGNGSNPQPTQIAALTAPERNGGKSEVEIPETVSPEGLRVRAQIARALGDESCARHLELAADKIEGQREELAQEAEARAAKYEKEVSNMRQVRSVPEPQLSKLKAQHWRLIADFIRTGQK